MTPEIAANILAFLQRVNLSGQEVPAYVEIVNALQPLAAQVEQSSEEVSEEA